MMLTFWKIPKLILLYHIVVSHQQIIISSVIFNVFGIKIRVYSQLTLYFLEKHSFGILEAGRLFEMYIRSKLIVLRSRVVCSCWAVYSWSCLLLSFLTVKMWYIYSIFMSALALQANSFSMSFGLYATALLNKLIRFSDFVAKWHLYKMQMPILVKKYLR